MARIREYNSQVSPSAIDRPNLGPEAFGAGSARNIQRLGQVVQGVGQAIEKYQVNSDISEATKELANIQKEYTAKWQSLAHNSDGSDDSLAENFMTELEERVSQVGGNLKTQKGREFFNDSSIQMTNRLGGIALETQAKLRGERAKQNFIETTNSLTSSAFSDPTSFQANLELNAQALDAMVESGALPRSAANELKQKSENEIAMSAMRGLIETNPSIAEQEINSSRWDKYLDGANKKTLSGELRVKNRADRVEQSRLESLQRRVQNERREQVKLESQEKFFEGTLTVKEVMDNQYLNSSDKSRYVNLIAKQAKGDGIEKTNPAVFNSTIERIHLPDGDPNKISDSEDINDLFLSGEIDQKTASILNREILAVKNSPEIRMKQEALKLARKELSQTNPGIGYVDDDGEERVQEFINFLNTEIESVTKSGKSVSEVLDPNSPNYAGKKIGAFQKSKSQVLSAQASKQRRKEIVGSLTGQNLEAFNWASANPKDPRSKQILQRLGM